MLKQESVNNHNAQHTYQSFQNLRGMRGLAAAVIRQAFEDADRTSSPVITTVEKKVKVVSKELFGILDKEKGLIYKAITEKNTKGKKKAKPKVLAELKNNKIYKPTTYKTIEYDVVEIQDSKQKLIYEIIDKKGRIFGYIERDKVYQATFRYKSENSNELDFEIRTKEKIKSLNSSSITKFEINSARAFILGDTKEWRESLCYYCDLADLDPQYIIRLAKQRPWYEEYMNENRLKGGILCQPEKRAMKLRR